MENETAIIVLDDTSKKSVKTNISALSTRGFKFIESLDEINDESIVETRKVILLEGIMQQPGIMSDLEMYQSLFDLEYYYLGANANNFRVLEGMCSCFKCDISLLDFSTIQAALFKDRALENAEAVDRTEIVEKAKRILQEEKDCTVLEVDLANKVMADLDIQQTLQNKIQKLQKRNSVLETINAKAKADRETLMTGYMQILNEASKEQEMLKQYEAIFTSDVYTKLRLHDYVNRPLVMYFKEYEDFLNLDQLLETLVSAFRLQERKRVKVLRLFDSVTSRKLLTVPTYYTKIYNEYSLADVLSKDFICKTGDYQKILDKLLLNEIGLDVLIIVDSKDYNDIVLSGTPLQINLCREIEHLPVLHLNEVNTLVNTGDSNSKFYWGRYDTSGMGKEEKFVFLSSRPVIGNLLNLYRLFTEAV